MRRLLAVFAYILFGLSPVYAQDIPQFLVGKVYSSDTKQCGDIIDADGDVLQLTKEGIYGQEFSCQFVGFEYDRDRETGRIYSVVATANCSDDSGIHRADMITLIPYEEGGEVIAQSQIEYILGETEVMIAQQMGKPFPEKSSYSWVSTTYNLCK